MTAVLLKGARVPLRLWADPSELEPEALQQLKKVKKLPWVFRHVAPMQDVHAGIGAAITWAEETHFGVQVLVTRKGAIRARKDELAIVPGSMGTRSYIVRGLGEPTSFTSASHGAGRRMSRAQARKCFTPVDPAAQAEGVECRKDPGILDEIPGAYKDIDAVMERQRDLVMPLHTLKQVLCVKG